MAPQEPWNGARTKQTGPSQVSGSISSNISASPNQPLTSGHNSGADPEALVRTGDPAPASRTEKAAESGIRRVTSGCQQPPLTRPWTVYQASFGDLIIYNAIVPS